MASFSQHGRHTIYRWPNIVERLNGHRKCRAADARVQCVVNENIAIDAKYLFANVTGIHIFIGGRREHLLACVANFSLMLKWVLLEVIDRK